jgi:hypothetical protein
VELAVEPGYITTHLLASFNGKARIIDDTAPFITGRREHLDDSESP